MKKSSKRPRQFRIGLTAPSEPLAREIRAFFRVQKFPVSRFVGFGTAEEEGKLSEIDGEASVLEVPRRETIADLDFLILAGSGADAEARSQAEAWSVPLHDLSPLPLAARGCAALAAALTPAPLSAAFTVLLPAAEEADRGIHELFTQTSDALNMKPMSSSVFPERLAFNVFRDGRTTERERHLRETLARRLEGCAISVVCARAGIFHGYAGSVALRFASPADARRAREALSKDSHVSIGRKPGHATPTLASESPEIRIDPPELRDDWLAFWFAFDGLALAAREAFAAARARLG